MARKPPEWFYKVPPIDFEALVRSAWRAPVRPTVGELKARKADRAKAKRRAEARRVERARKRRRAERPGYTGPPVATRIARAMGAGRWLGRPDILAASDLSYGSIKMVTQRMWRAGLLERAQNPDWRAIVYPRGRRIETVEGFRGRPPRWLYRLTAEGEGLLDD